jgi:hypothetical protein
MRRTILNLSLSMVSVSLLSLFAAPLLAQDALITLTEVTGGTGTFTFLVPASAVSPGENTALDPGSFFVNAEVTATGTSCTTASYCVDQVNFFNSANGGGLGDFGTVILNLASDPTNTVVPNSLFYDSLIDPVFDIGTSGVLDTFDVPAGPTYDYTNTSAAAPSTPGVTPEPSSLLLFGTGTAGLLAFYRRRAIV